MRSSLDITLRIFKYHQQWKNLNILKDAQYTQRTMFRQNKFGNNWNILTITVSHPSWEWSTLKWEYFTVI